MKLRLQFVWYLCTIWLWCFDGQAQEFTVMQYVQPLSGTAASTTKAATKHSEASSEQYANTIPSVTLPFAMTQWTPQTRKTEQKCVAPYYYSDSLINGFRASHWLSGSCTQDYGSLSVMAVSGSLKNALANAESTFSHVNEKSGPAYYQVKLDRYSLNVEMTGTARCGMIRVTALTTDSVYLLINANSDEQLGRVELQDNGQLTAVNPVHRIYQGWGDYAGFDGSFCLETDKKAETAGVFKEGKPLSLHKIIGNELSGAYIGFFLKKGESVCLRIGTSFTGVKGARKNLDNEMPFWDFDAIRERAERIWEASLGAIAIHVRDDQQKRIFYTALYHTMQHPRLFNDVDGLYPKFAKSNELALRVHGNYYDDFSMWDIYRAQIPLMEILQPKLVKDLVLSLLAKGEQGGWLPIFPCWNSYTAAMIGDHTASVISSAYLKGIIKTESEKAYQFMRKNAFELANPIDYQEGKGRRAISSYLEYQLIPMEDSVPFAFHKKEQVSRTLEYAYDDYALARFAKSLGKEADYGLLMQRAKNYKNVFDPMVGMVRGRYKNGDWYEPFNPEKRESYITEGTPHQYTFYVPQDIPGLARLMGGREFLEKSLDSLFDGGGYWHGNEPGHQIPFLYNYTGAPWKTPQRVRQILDEEYSDGPGGLSGNDDAGQMSAWYIFAALGFYPVDPISGNYLLTTPAYQAYEIFLPKNNHWKVRCDHLPIDYPYIQSVYLNGVKLQRNYISYEEIVKGGELKFVLSKQPTRWTSNEEEQASGL